MTTAVGGISPSNIEFWSFSQEKILIDEVACFILFHNQPIICHSSICMQVQHLTSSCTVMTQPVVDLVGFIWIFCFSRVQLGLVRSIEGKGKLEFLGLKKLQFFIPTMQFLSHCNLASDDCAYMCAMHFTASPTILGHFSINTNEIHVHDVLFLLYTKISLQKK